MLQLLLSLSSSKNQTYDFIPRIDETIVNEEKLTWGEVVKDDPLEGDHWQKWPEYSVDDDFSDDDGYEFDEETAAARQVYLFL